MTISVCSACERTFASVSSFDAHRIGSYSDRSRRCMSEEEMRVADLGVHPVTHRWNFIESSSITSCSAPETEQPITK